MPPAFCEYKNCVSERVFRQDLITLMKKNAEGHAVVCCFENEVSD
jgi:hypothetical protein